MALEEKKLDFSLELEKIWEQRPPFLHLNATGTIPVLVDLNGTTIAESSAIVEYLQEAYPAPSIYPEDIVQRAEARRIAAWIDDRFSREVSLVLVFEKVLKRYYSKGSSPNSGLVREARARINFYLDHISWFVDRRRWLAGETFSIADIAVAAHLSIIDYMGDVPWDKHQSAKEWYARIKSRPSFRGLLADRIVGHTPASHYTDLDF